MTDDERAIMDVAARWWRNHGARDEAARALGYTPTRCYQLLAALLERQDVEAAYPAVVHRLRRQTAPRPGRGMTMGLD